MNKYCKDAGENPCAAVPQEEYGVECYCCCSCFAYDTPIEATLGEYVAVQDIVARVDSILAGSYRAGAKAPEWTSRTVEYSAGISAGVGEPELEFDYMYYVAYQVADGSDAPQFILTTVDHLFLRPNGKVTPVQYLAPDDTIVSSHGGLSRVMFVVPAKYKGGLHHLTFGDFNNETLDDHLISANGVVTADYSVQLAYSSGNLNPALLDAPPEGALLRASDRAYQARYANKAALEFVADKARWPAGMTPLASEPMVNVPRLAKSYMTADQAADILANAPALAPDNTANVAGALWLFEIFAAFYSDPIYLVDWQNETPNAYTWVSNRQTFVLVTGGLLRVQTFSQDGLSMVLAHLVSIGDGIECVGPADYEAVFTKTRQIWRNRLFSPTFRAGYDQCAQLFSYVTPENAKANPADICNQPSLDCRLLAMSEAASMGPLPACANPNLWFGLLSARSGRTLQFINLKFNSEVNKATGQTTKNYTVTAVGGRKPLKVDAAELSTTDQAEVRLKVAGMAALTDYKVTVANVISVAEATIDPAHASADFRSGKLLG